MTSNRFFIIAVDGGAASGKSSTSRRVAARLDLMHVDTGSHFRAVTHALLAAGCTLQEGAQLASFLEKLCLGSRVQGRQALLTLAGVELQDHELRRAEINRNVSIVAALPLVRKVLKDYQRNQINTARSAGFKGLIMEGRDIGSVIFPQADLKIYLEADVATRQSRRAAEGQEDTVAARDKLDSSRRTAPLRAAGDAVLLDTSQLDIEMVVSAICRLAQERAQGLFDQP